MKKTDRFVLEEYKKRAEQLENLIDERKEKITELEEEIKELDEKATEKQTLFKKGEVYTVEKKFGGWRALLHKSDDEVKLFASDMQDLTNSFPTIKEQAKKLSQEDFILDGKVVPYKDGDVQSGKELIKILKSEKSDKDVKIHISDVVYFNESLLEKPWFKRHKILKKLNFTENIKKVPSMIVRNEEQMEKALKVNSAKPGSKGAFIKLYNSRYPTGETRKWFEYVPVSHLNAVVLNKEKKNGSFRYEVGIKVGKDTKRLKGENLVKIDKNTYHKIGTTTKVSANLDKGDKVKIRTKKPIEVNYGDKVEYYLEDCEIVDTTDKGITDIDNFKELVDKRGEILRE